MFVMHGALYMAIKTEGEFQERMARWASGCWIAFVILYCLATFYSFFAAPHLFDSILSKPMFWIFFILLLASIIYIPLAIRAKRYFPGFLGSSLAIVCIIGLAAVSMFPKLMVSNIDMAHSLTIYNASSTPRTLATMLVIALIGMPIVLIYTIYIYSVFKGKTEVSEEGY
jgi:cytochrome d ubiquinol oxidase subunit II